MKRGQAVLELLIGYSLAVVIIAISVSLLFTFYPNIASFSSTPSYSGFSGLRILGQGYDASAGVFYIAFQNTLNENIKINLLEMVYGSVTYTGFSCTKTFLPNLYTSECNLSIPISGSFSAQIFVYYNPANISVSPTIGISGYVTN